mmetsp:Transcript_54441/g.151011  ORF Transcript_54441/g.151011 Transcript_54441/m.151011 type:complete len:412 (-) Transcript_54441:94-1329(-)
MQHRPPLGSEPLWELVHGIPAEWHCRFPHCRSHGHAGLPVHVHAAIGPQVVHRRGGLGLHGRIWPLVPHGPTDPVHRSRKLLCVHLKESQVCAVLEEEPCNIYYRSAVAEVHKAVFLVQAGQDSPALLEGAGLGCSGQFEDTFRHVSETLDGSEGRADPQHRKLRIYNLRRDAAHDMRANPSCGFLTDRLRAHWHSLLIPRDDAHALQGGALESQANPFARDILIEVVCCGDQAAWHSGGVSEAVSLKGRREVSLARGLGLFPQCLLTHVVQHLWRSLFLHRTAAHAVQLAQLGGDLAVRAVFADAAIRPESRQADWHVLGAALGELRLEALAPLNEDGLPGKHLQALALRVMQDHAPLEDAHPLVIMKGKPGFTGGCTDLHQGDADAVGLAGHIACQLIDCQVARVHDAR